MKCLILCAGYATRLYPLTENFPKPLLPVKGKPIIDYLIDDLENGKYINQYIIVSNHKFVNHFLDWKKTRKEDVVIVDDGTTNNENRLGAVKDIELAIDQLQIDDDLLVLAGDNLLSFSLNEFVNFFKEKKNSSVMVYYEKDSSILYKRGVCTFDENHVLTSMEEKPKNPKSNYCVPPFYLYKKEDLHYIKEGLESGCGIDAPGHFLEWFCKQVKCNVFIMPGERYDIGCLEDYNKIQHIDFQIKK